MGFNLNMTNMEYYSVLTGIQSCENIILKLCIWNFFILVGILKFHIRHYLNNSKKCHTWHSPGASFTYGTLKCGLDLQCNIGHWTTLYYNLPNYIKYRYLTGKHKNYTLHYIRSCCQDVFLKFGKYSILILFYVYYQHT